MFTLKSLALYDQLVTLSDDFENNLRDLGMDVYSAFTISRFAQRKQLSVLDVFQEYISSEEIGGILNNSIQAFVNELKLDIYAPNKYSLDELAWYGRCLPGFLTDFTEDLIEHGLDSAKAKQVSTRAFENCHSIVRIYQDNIDDSEVCNVLDLSLLKFLEKSRNEK